MSYDIYLNDPVTGETLKLDVPHYMRGGTYCDGGTKEAHINCTYNYAPQFVRVFDMLDKPRATAPDWMHNGHYGQVCGIRTIYGLTGAESLPVLDKAIAALGDDVDADYWEATDGNAKRVLMQLRALATMRPDGVWAGN